MRPHLNLKPSFTYKRFSQMLKSHEKGQAKRFALHTIEFLEKHKWNLSVFFNIERPELDIIKVTQGICTLSQIVRSHCMKLRSIKISQSTNVLNCLRKNVARGIKMQMKHLVDLTSLNMNKMSFKYGPWIWKHFKIRDLDNFEILKIKENCKSWKNIRIVKKCRSSS